MSFARLFRALVVSERSFLTLVVLVSFEIIVAEASCLDSRKAKRECASHNLNGFWQTGKGHGQMHRQKRKIYLLSGSWWVKQTSDHARLTNSNYFKMYKFCTKSLDSILFVWNVSNELAFFLIQRDLFYLASTGRRKRCIECALAMFSFLASAVRGGVFFHLFRSSEITGMGVFSLPFTSAENAASWIQQASFVTMS